MDKPLTAIEKLKAEFISMSELCHFLGMAERRCKDLISLHKNDGNFMPAFKAAAGVYYFRYEDVKAYLESRVSSLETSRNNDKVD